MSPEISFAILAVLGLAWIVVRVQTGRAKRRRAAQKRRLDRSRDGAASTGGRNTQSQRSAMRSTDAPVTIIDSVRRSGNRRPSADPKGKLARRR